MSYIENPKTKGSGIVACIPQKGLCPNGCEDCFFQSDALTLDKNLPNMPSSKEGEGRIVRVNDGNDSSIDREAVMASTWQYANMFFNTAIPRDLEGFEAPVVLTINPGRYTDLSCYYIKEPIKNLMFVRVRTNTWNLDTVVRPAIKFYSEREVPIVLTFMAYYAPKESMGNDYVFRKRTLNSFWAITTASWMKIMDEFRLNKWVSSCGKIEGELGTTACRFCGNCLREYFATMERMR